MKGLISHHTAVQPGVVVAIGKGLGAWFNWQRLI
jgi:hypothetical protein